MEWQTSKGTIQSQAPQVETEAFYSVKQYDFETNPQQEDLERLRQLNTFLRNQLESKERNQNILYQGEQYYSYVINSNQNFEYFPTNQNPNLKPNHKEEQYTQRSNSLLFTLSEKDEEETQANNTVKVQQTRVNSTVMLDQAGGYRQGVQFGMYKHGAQEKSMNRQQSYQNWQNANFQEIISNERAPPNKKKGSSQTQLEQFRKYEQFAEKISKLFRVDIRDLQKVYLEIKQEKQRQNSWQNEQRSEVMQKLFQYAKQLKNSHKKLKNMVKIIEDIQHKQQIQNQQQIQKKQSIRKSNSPLSNSSSKQVQSISLNFVLEEQNKPPIDLFYPRNQDQKLEKQSQKTDFKKSSNNQKSGNVRNKDTSVMNTQSIAYGSSSPETNRQVPHTQLSIQTGGDILNISSMKSLKNYKVSGRKKKLKVSEKIKKIAEQLQALKMQMDQESSQQQNQQQPQTYINHQQKPEPTNGYRLKTPLQIFNQRGQQSQQINQSQQIGQSQQLKKSKEKKEEKKQPVNYRFARDTYTYLGSQQALQQIESDEIGKVIQQKLKSCIIKSPSKKLIQSRNNHVSQKLNSLTHSLHKSQKKAEQLKENLHNQKVKNQQKSLSAQKKLSAEKRKQMFEKIRLRNTKKSIEKKKSQIRNSLKLQMINIPNKNGPSHNPNKNEPTDDNKFSISQAKPFKNQVYLDEDSGQKTENLPNNRQPKNPAQKSLLKVQQLQHNNNQLSVSKSRAEFRKKRFYKKYVMRQGQLVIEEEEIPFSPSSSQVNLKQRPSFSHKKTATFGHVENMTQPERLKEQNTPISKIQNRKQSIGVIQSNLATQKSIQLSQSNIPQGSNHKIVSTGNIPFSIPQSIYTPVIISPVSRTNIQSGSKNAKIINNNSSVVNHSSIYSARTIQSKPLIQTTKQIPDSSNKFEQKIKIQDLSSPINKKPFGTQYLQRPVTCRNNSYIPPSIIFGCKVISPLKNEQPTARNIQPTSVKPAIQPKRSYSANKAHSVSFSVQGNNLLSTQNCIPKSSKQQNVIPLRISFHSPLSAPKQTNRYFQQSRSPGQDFKRSHSEPVFSQGTQKHENTKRKPFKIQNTVELNTLNNHNQLQNRQSETNRHYRQGLANEGRKLTQIQTQRQLSRLTNDNGNQQKHKLNRMAENNTQRNFSESRLSSRQKTFQSRHSASRKKGINLTDSQSRNSSGNFAHSQIEDDQFQYKNLINHIYFDEPLQASNKSNKNKIQVKSGFVESKVAPTSFSKNYDRPQVPQQFRPPKYVSPKVSPHHIMAQRKQQIQNVYMKQNTQIPQNNPTRLQEPKNNQRDSEYLDQYPKTYALGALVHSRTQNNHYFDSNKLMNKQDSERKSDQAIINSQVHARPDLLFESTPSFGQRNQQQQGIQTESISPYKLNESKIRVASQSRKSYHSPRSRSGRKSGLDLESKRNKQTSHRYYQSSYFQ